ncbi:hypothetical protein LCI18_013182 [Fusarium solani-melongenae]|uniref:Uncharacterized protein n=1 Tax=Fusarium solani subsp. cucurbitae TaxID=2747967 RepID=A0ACD3ZMC0_FUSSC|nr:hypothetical protein LCI18_013182 [Fusarium solani-melongenae]
MPDAPMCGMAKNRLLWPVEKHWLNVRFLNGSRSSRELVRSIVEEHFDFLPIGIKFYFYQRGKTGEVDIRIKFSNTSRCYVGTAAKSVRRGSKPTMRLDLETPKCFSGQDRRLCLHKSVLHEFGHALGLFHGHQHLSYGKKWDMTLLQYRTGWSQQMAHHSYAPIHPKARLWSPMIQSLSCTTSSERAMSSTARQRFPATPSCRREIKESSPCSTRHERRARLCNRETTQRKTLPRSKSGGSA